MKLERIAGPMVKLALTEDIGAGDVTTEGVVPEDATAAGAVIARATGVLAGLDVARIAFATIAPSIAFEPLLKDGAAVKPGVEICKIRGPARGILTAERVALNFLQRLSGIATVTRRYVDAVKGTGAVILDTRKTTPGLRVLEKYAVSVGGGGNHRFGLFDMYLIKDNHLKIAGGVREAVSRARSAKSDLAVEVEVTTIEELKEACAAGVDRVMLDNMPLDLVKTACEIVKGLPEAEGRPKVEVSGGVTLESVRDLALCGVDYISVGALTHSAPGLDMSLELE
jgi:nicotinate-nucleotide pyrophosphorylase (carboxylating)